jgi:hypothetical protein
MPEIPATPGYFKWLVRESRSRAWDIVFADRPVTVILAWAVACFAVYLQRRLTHESSDQVREALISIGCCLIAYGVAFVLIFCAQFCYFTPKRLVKNLKTELTTTQLIQDRVKIRNRLSAYLHQIEESIADLRGYHAVMVVTFDEKDKEQKLKLVGEIADYMTQNWGLSYAAEFMSNTGFVSNAQPRDEHQKTVEILEWRAEHLKELVARYKTTGD